MEFGELLRRMRDSAGLTQLELAVAVDVSERTVRAWETEKPPPPGKARRVAEVLGLSGAGYTRFMALADGEFRSAYAIYDKLQSPSAARLAALLESS